MIKKPNKKDQKIKKTNNGIIDLFNKIIGNSKKRYYLTFAFVIILLIIIFVVMSLLDVI